MRSGELNEITDQDLPKINRTWADFWEGKYLEALDSLRAANRGLARLTRKRDSKPVDMIEALIGSTTEEWVGFVNMLVSKHSNPATDAPQRTHTYTVYSEMLDYVKSALDRKMRDSEPFDQVIATAQIMSWALAMWASAVVHAKAFDPKRPVEERRKMLVWERQFARSFASYLLKRPEMRGPWAGQEWENPFAARSEEGKKDAQD